MRLYLFWLSLYIFVATAAAATRRRSIGERNIPWDQLAAKISPNVLIDTSNEEYGKQCLPEFEFEDGRPTLSSFLNTHENLVNAPNGICMIGFYSGFKKNIPFPNAKLTYKEIIDKEKYTFLKVREYVNNITNPQYNLPPKVVFPAVTADVVAIVDFANKHQFELSVKASGHNYAGASTKSDTLLVNMRDITINGGVTECREDETINDDFSNQACYLVRKRNLNGYIRVSGTESFGSAFKSVREFNEAQSEFKYLLVGGASPTVTTQGWTFAGGLASTTGGRLFGFGSDQVVQVEMVLPKGQLVRFGPSKVKEKEKEFLYPTAEIISGVCCTNPHENDETKFVWKQCSRDIKFDDLWFAVLGGGGGTYGIVTSLRIQLQDYLPLENVAFDILGCLGSQFYGYTSLDKIVLDFFVSFFLDPESLKKDYGITVTKEESMACGVVSLDRTMYCYGKNSGIRAAAVWKQYWLGRKDDAVKILMDHPLNLGQNESEFHVNAYASCLGQETSTNQALFKYKDYLEAINSFTGDTFDRPIGALFNYPYLDSHPNTVNVLFPTDWILKNKSEFNQNVAPLLFNTYWAFSNNTAKAQNNNVIALSDAYRQAGVMVFLPESLVDLWWGATLDACNIIDSDPIDFPSFVGANHINPSILGPLKNDFTKPCPQNITIKEREEQCISTQTIIYGAKNLKRLERIKHDIDPSFLLDCNICVGNNKAPKMMKSKQYKIKKSNKKEYKIKKSNKKGKKQKK